jgi:hypothetical protein
MKEFLAILFLFALCSQAVFLKKGYTHPAETQYSLQDPTTAEVGQFFSNVQVPLYPEYPETEYVSNADLCNMLINQLVAFGANSTAIYDQCPYKYQLLGVNNPAMLEEQPPCYWNLVSSFCKYDIVNYETPFSIDTIEFVLQNIINCIDGFEHIAGYSKCPTLDLKTGFIGDEEKFCELLEQKQDFENHYDGNPADNGDHLTFESNKFVVIGVVSKQMQSECVSIARLYNYCLQTHNNLGMTDKRMCYSRFFGPYQGAVLKKYNLATVERCENAVLPYFAYESRIKDLLQTATSFGFCSNIDYNMNQELYKRIDELNEDIKAEMKNQTAVKKVLEQLKNITDSMSFIVTQLHAVETSWQAISQNITYFSEGTGVVNVSNVFRTNVLLMNESLVSMYQIAIASDEYVHSKKFYNDGTLNDFKLLTDYFQRIDLLSNNVLEFAGYLDALIEGKDLFDKPGLDDHDLTMLEINISAEITPMNNMVYNIQQDFEQSFTRITIQVTQQRRIYEDRLKLAQDKIAGDTTIKGYIQKQIEIDTIYA